MIMLPLSSYETPNNDILLFIFISTFKQEAQGPHRSPESYKHMQS
jgi:hypothetical protein